MATKRKSHRKQFSEEMVRKLNPPRTGRVDYTDTVERGLVLRVTSRRLKTWNYVYRLPGDGRVSPITGRPMAGKQHRVTLGTFPRMSVAAARERAQALAIQVADGIKPTAEGRPPGNTFGDLCALYLEHQAHASPRSIRLVRIALENHVLPQWRNKPLERDAKEWRQDFHALLDALRDAKRLGTAREVRKWTVAAFAFAVDRGLLGISPVAGTKRRDLRKQGLTGRALSDADLRAIWAATHDAPLFRLLILTGCRRAEWGDAQWSEISGEAKTLLIPAARYKTGIDMLVPLVPAAWAIVEGLPRRGPYLFGVTAAFTGWTTAIAALRARTPEIAKWSPHDFRRTCETRLANEELFHSPVISTAVRDAVLGHVKPGHRDTYNRHDYAAEKRAALQRYADHLLKIINQ
jgi:integrase